MIVVNCNGLMMIILMSHKYLILHFSDETPPASNNNAANAFDPVRGGAADSGPMPLQV
jgi:hypothetical protein